LTPIRFDPERPNSAWWYMLETGVFLLVSHAPYHPKAPGFHGAKNFLGPPTCARTVWETATKFCIVIKLNGRKILQAGCSTPLSLNKNFCVTNADAQSVCGRKPCNKVLLIYVCIFGPRLLKMGRVSDPTNTPLPLWATMLNLVDLGQTV